MTWLAICQRSRRGEVHPRTDVPRPAVFARSTDIRKSLNLASAPAAQRSGMSCSKIRCRSSRVEHWHAGVAPISGVSSLAGSNSRRVWRFKRPRKASRSSLRKYGAFRAISPAFLTSPATTKMRSRWMDVRADLHAAPAKPSPGLSRSALSRACAGQRCSWTSSSCGSGRGKACSCRPSNRPDSLCESTAVRVLQQRPAAFADIRLECSDVDEAFDVRIDASFGDDDAAVGMPNEQH